MSLRLCLLLTLIVLSSACTTIRVEPLKTPLASLCIEENPEVQVDDFLGTLQRGFARHGIETRLYKQIPASGCPQRTRTASARQGARRQRSAPS